jgi:cytochrome c556
MSAKSRNLNLAKIGARASICVCCLLTITSVRHAALADEATANAAGAIFERQQIMQQLDKDAELLGDIAAGDAPADKLPEVTRSIAQGARDTRASFQQRIPGGRTKPEAWSNWADFSQRMDGFVTNADALAKVGQSGNVEAATSVMATALPCKECHDLYRMPKRDRGAPNPTKTP